MAIPRRLTQLLPKGLEIYHLHYAPLPPPLAPYHHVAEPNHTSLYYARFGITSEVLVDDEKKFGREWS